MFDNKLKKFPSDCFGKQLLEDLPACGILLESKNQKTRALLEYIKTIVPFQGSLRTEAKQVELRRPI